MLHQGFAMKEHLSPEHFGVTVHSDWTLKSLLQFLSVMHGANEMVDVMQNPKAMMASSFIFLRANVLFGKKLPRKPFEKISKKLSGRFA